MLGILNYDPDNAEFISNLLKKIGFESKIIHNEFDLLSAEKIILPDCEFLGLAIRKLQVSNLFNALKILQKPFLGINCGMFLLCNEVINYHLFGLNLFPLKIDRLKKYCSFDLFDKPAKVEIVQKSKLFSDIAPDVRFNFHNKFFIYSKEYETSTLKIDWHEISTSIEKENIFGIQFNIVDDETSLKILYNFSKI